MPSGQALRVRLDASTGVDASTQRLRVMAQCGGAGVLGAAEVGPGPDGRTYDFGVVTTAGGRCEWRLRSTVDASMPFANCCAVSPRAIFALSWCSHVLSNHYHCVASLAAAISGCRLQRFSCV